MSVIELRGETKRRFGAIQLVIIAVSSALYAVLGIASATFAIAPGGITLFYLPDAYIVPASMWFGVWGALGAFFGTLLFSPFFGYGYLLGLAFAVIDISSPLIAGFMLRLFKVDASLRDKRSLGLYFAFGVILNGLVESLLGSVVMVAVGWYSWTTVAFPALVWFTGVVSSTLIISPILLRVLTPFLSRTRLFHRGFVSR